MPNLTQAIATYSFIDRPHMDLGTFDPSDSNTAILTRIEALMTSANASFNARKYDDAIKGYHATESLIYAHIDPAWVPELGGKLRPLLPRDPSLFDPLLSATSQWLNILSVPMPTSPVRTATAVDPQLLSSVANLHGAGLNPVSTNPSATAQALSDLRLAAIYRNQGNTTASSTLVTRAQGLNSAIANALTPTGAATHPSFLTDDGPLPRSALVPIERQPNLPTAVLDPRQVGLLSGSGTQVNVKSIQWSANGGPDIESIKSILYAPHVTAAALPDVLMNTVTPWERAVRLPHDYHYVIPLALAKCHHAMGDYAQGETYYLQAAQYAYINTAVEGPYVWVQLASLYRDWGNSLYEQGDRTTAAAIYGKVIAFGSSTPPPSSPLYALAGLATARNIVKTLIPQLATLATNGASGVSADNIAIASLLLQINAKLGQISGGLDYWGHYAAAVPIWTFSYLQQTAINFTQLALQAERDVINYWSQADQATLTKTELTNQVAQAKGQVNAAMQQLYQAKQQAQAYQAALTLAQERAVDAKQDANKYLADNSHAILLQAVGQQVAGGDDGNYDLVSDMACHILQGYGMSGFSDPTLAAAVQLAANRLSQDYQVFSLNQTAAEMQQAVVEAQDQLNAANAQVAAAQANLTVAQLEASGAAQVLSVFSTDTFSPQVWRAMGNFVEAIYARYMNMALRAAKLMQQAYNFENDTTLNFIHDSYQGVVDGLLAADSLMADIQAFTDDLVTSNRGKKQLIKTSISLASNYGYLFETQLRKTGRMVFETTLDDFDSAMPGTYQGRIQHVAVSVQGIVPPTGLSGSLSNNGISLYRLPSDAATPASPSKQRIQSAETMVLSDYDPLQDGMVSSATGNQTGIFEGAGVASSWTLSLPRALNDMDYGTLTDVVLTFLYEARYDPQLAGTVLSQLASRPGYHNRERSIPVGWLYPDLFYSFKSSGNLTLNLATADFPLNQTVPLVTAVSLLLVMKPGTSAQGITLSMTAPGRNALSGVTDSSGTISSQGTGSTWAGTIGGSAIGNWTVNLAAAANPTHAPGGKLDLSSLINLVLVFSYSFTPRS